MKKILAVVSAFLLSCALALVVTSPAKAAYASTPWYGSWVHSKTSMNYVYIVDDTDSRWPVTAAMNLWNSYFAVNNMNVRFAVPYYGTCADANGPLPRCFYTFQDDSTGGTFADAFFNVDTEGFEDEYSAIANFSASYFNKFHGNHINFHNGTISTAGQWAGARETIVMHELGHELALGHNSTNGDLMNGVYKPVANQSPGTPSAGDILSINALFKLY